MLNMKATATLEERQGKEYNSVPSIAIVNSD